MQPPRRVLALLVLLAGPALAEAPQEATLELWNRPVVVLRKTVGERTPAQRVESAAQRIAGTSTELMRGDVSIARFSSQYGEGLEVELRGSPAFRLYPEDLDPESGETLPQAGEAAAQRLREALAARVLQADAGQVARGALLALGATALFALLLTAIVRSRRFVTAHLFVASERRLRRVARIGFDPRRYLLLGAKYAVDALALGVGGLLAYLWLTFVFVQFPYSAPWGEQLGHYLFDLAGFLGANLLRAVPDFFTVLVILGITRALTRVVAHFFQTVGAGRIRSPWLDAETAEATRRIVVGVIWVFALTAAFPFIPGSDSAAFRGVGVLAGLMLSLGSAGIVNQAMSGLVGRSVRSRVRSSGAARSRPSCATLPNGVVTGSPIVNYTRLASDGGAQVTATVTIGYDAPWRQVHALLELAASRTAGLLATPAPYVVQRALSDFYVEYQLVAQAERSEDRPLALSRLHAEIQDAFNAHGVQIMSPHFRGQPAAAVVVPQEKWYAPPAPKP